MCVSQRFQLFEEMPVDIASKMKGKKNTGDKMRRNVKLVDAARYNGYLRYQFGADRATCSLYEESFRRSDAMTRLSGDGSGTVGS